jgi:hypothetical protein
MEHFSPLKGAKEEGGEIIGKKKRKKRKTNLGKKKQGK